MSPFFALLIFQEMRHRCYCLSDNIKCFFCHLTLNPFRIKDSDFFYNTLVKSCQSYCKKKFQFLKYPILHLIGAFIGATCTFSTSSISFKVHRSRLRVTTPFLDNFTFINILMTKWHERLIYVVHIISLLLNFCFTLFLYCLIVV